MEGNDPYLTGVDFADYIRAQNEIDEVFKDKKSFCRRSVLALANSGSVSIDKSILSLCDKVWNVKQCAVPKPALDPRGRVISSTNLQNLITSAS